jgi:hypothetical protein
MFERTMCSALGLFIGNCFAIQLRACLLSLLNCVKYQPVSLIVVLRKPIAYDGALAINSDS